MARYKVVQDALMSFTAHVTRVGGLIETQREFTTELDALDWVGEGGWEWTSRLGGKPDPLFR